MALLCSIATGNASAAATWGLVDATSHANVENATESLLTTAYSGTRSAVFAPGAITVSHLLVKLCERIGTTGTMSVSLRNATIGLDDFVAGTEVTIDVADLPDALETQANGGWVSFKLAAPVLLLAATNYNIQAKTSSATQVDLWCTASADNLSRCLVTTATPGIAAGDDMIVVGEKTGAGTGNAFTVTWDITATTDFGSAPTAVNSLVSPGLAICNGGTLSVGTTAATQYVMKMSNSIIIYSGGTFNAGTSGTPIPSGSSFTLTFDCGANVDYGFIRRNLGTRSLWGTKGFTSSPSNHYTLLTADEAAGQSVIGAVGDTTGWEVDDEICFSSTSRTYTEHQMCKIKTVDSSTAFTLWVAADAKAMSNGANAAILTAAKSGTNTGNEDTRCEIGNLTRNVKIQGASKTLQGYVSCSATGDDTWRYAEFKYLGSATTGKRGIDIATTTGTFDCQYCSLHTCTVTNSYGFNITAASGSAITISNNVCYNCALMLTVIATTGTWIINNNLFCLGFTSAQAVTLADIGGTFTNNFITSSGGVGLLINEAGASGVGTISGNVIHSGAVGGVILNSSMPGTLASFRIWGGTSSGANVANLNIDLASPNNASQTILDGFIVFGSSSRNVSISGGICRMVNPIIFGGALGSQTGISFGTNHSSNVSNTGDASFIEIENGLIGVAVSHTNSDISVLSDGVGPRCIMHNTTLGSTTEVASPANLGYGAFICSLKHNTTAGNHLTWKPGGRTSGASLLPDTVIYNTASPSLRMYPGSASIKLESSTWEVAVASGQTLTPSVLVRYSKVGDSGGVDYVPTTAPRLVVKRNVAAGITADTVLATHGGGADWVTLSGTTAAVTDDAILEFFVDCDGSTGWINVDDFSCVGANPGGMNYWSPSHAGPLALGQPAGGGLMRHPGMSGGING